MPKVRLVMPVALTSSVAAPCEIDPTVVGVDTVGNKIVFPALLRFRRPLIACGVSSLAHVAAVVALGLTAATRPEPVYVPRLEAAIVPSEALAVERLPELKPPDPQPTLSFEALDLKAASDLPLMVTRPSVIASVTAPAVSPTVALDVF